MPQIAWFRGALWNPSKVDLARVSSHAVTNVKERLKEGELVRDPSRAIYRYAQTFQQAGRPVTRKTLLAAIKLAPWSDGSVRAHEATSPVGRELAAAGIAREGAHTDALFVGYRDAAREVDRLLRKIEDEKPALEVATPDGTVHRVWREKSAEVFGKLRPLFAPKKLHVLDGQSRYEGMLAYQQQLGGDALATYSSANYGLACLVNVEDPALEVAPRHRVVRGAPKREDVLAAAGTHFIVEKIAGAGKDQTKQRAALADTVAHQPAFLALFPNETDAWKLTLKPDVSPVTEGVEIHRALQKYDPVVVEHLFLRRVVPGATATAVLEPATVQKALDGGAELGLILRPLAIDQVLHADELGQLLPFGSTAFRPALARLVTYIIDKDEDLV